MSTTGTRKVHTNGTHRTRAPEETWEIIRPRFERYGITRVSDVTGLDHLGIPVAMATRPLSWTLSVSQGKGQSLLLAKVSAAMEGIEFWHAERVRPPLTHRAVAAADLDLGYDVREIGMTPSPFLSERTPLDWVDAVGMETGRTVPVPVDEICFRDPAAHRWSPVELRPSSNGLASGNCREEAALHALYEVIERDALSRPTLAEIAAAPSIDPASVPDPVCAAMVEAITGAGGQISIALLPSRFGVPTFKCLVWSWDFPVVCGGSGSHGDPLIALSRAVTEAAQGRLAAIVGSRDDLEHFWSTMDHAHQHARIKGQFPAPTASYDDATAGFVQHHDDLGEELASMVRRVREVVGSEPLLVDLSTDDDIAVVKVVVPRSAMAFERVHVRTQRGA